MAGAVIRDQAGPRRCIGAARANQHPTATAQRQTKREESEVPGKLAWARVHVMNAEELMVYQPFNEVEEAPAQGQRPDERARRPRDVRALAGNPESPHPHRGQQLPARVRLHRHSGAAMGVPDERHEENLEWHTNERGHVLEAKPVAAVSRRVGLPVVARGPLGGTEALTVADTWRCN